MLCRCTFVFFEVVEKTSAKFRGVSPLWQHVLLGVFALLVCFESDAARSLLAVFICTASPIFFFSHKTGH